MEIYIYMFFTRSSTCLSCVYPLTISGTRSHLLERRKRDTYDGGLGGWSILSVHNWGEDPRGKWFIEVSVSVSA